MATPMLVGILNDMSEGPPPPGDTERWLRFAIDELIGTGRLDRDVEFVHSFGLGLPSGTAAAVERAYDELVDHDVLVIVGPAIGDNALVATPVAERHRVPTINWAGSERARSEYMFHLQVGSHEEEPMPSLYSGRPKRRTARTPASAARLASSTASATRFWKTPGIDLISTRGLSFGTMNCG